VLCSRRSTSQRHGPHLLAARRILVWRTRHIAAQSRRECGRGVPLVIGRVQGSVPTLSNTAKALPLRSERSPSLVARLTILYIITVPAALALRGVSEQVGNLTLLATDAVFVAAFLLSLLNRVSITGITSVAILVQSALFFLLAPDFPGADTLYLGIRKSVFFLMAVSIGLAITSRSKRHVLTALVVVLVFVCGYGLKQAVHLSEYDRMLMSTQAAGYFTGVYRGQVRASSVLSSGFQLGMAGALLLSLVLSMRMPAWARLVVAGFAVLSIMASITRTFLVISALLVVLWTLSKTWLRATFVLAFLAAVALTSELTGNSLIELLLSDSRFTNRSASYVRFVSLLDRFPLGSLVGFGPGSAGSTLGEAFRVTGAAWFEPHSIYLKYVFEFGLPVAAIALLAVSLVVLRGFALHDEAIGVDRWLSLYAASIIAVSGFVITSVEAAPISLYIGILIGIMPKRRRLPSKLEAPVCPCPRGLHSSAETHQPLHARRLESTHQESSSTEGPQRE
jgi:hypothetical protein